MTSTKQAQVPILGSALKLLGTRKGQIAASGLASGLATKIQGGTNSEQIKGGIAGAVGMAPFTFLGGASKVQSEKLKYNPSVLTDRFISALTPDDFTSEQLEQLSPHKDQISEGMEGFRYLQGMRKPTVEHFKDEHPYQAVQLDAAKIQPLLGQGAGLGLQLKEGIGAQRYSRALKKNVNNDEIKDLIRKFNTAKGGSNKQFTVPYFEPEGQEAFEGLSPDMKHSARTTAREIAKNRVGLEQQIGASAPNKIKNLDLSREIKTDPQLRSSKARHQMNTLYDFIKKQTPSLNRLEGESEGFQKALGLEGRSALNSREEIQKLIDPNFVRGSLRDELVYDAFSGHGQDNNKQIVDQLKRRIEDTGKQGAKFKELKGQFKKDDILGPLRVANKGDIFKGDRTQRLLRQQKRFGIPMAQGLGVYGLGRGLNSIQEKFYGPENTQKWKDSARQVAGDFLPNE